jgi:hypothetical protein
MLFGIPTRGVEGAEQRNGEMDSRALTGSVWLGWPVSRSMIVMWTVQPPPALIGAAGFGPAFHQ